MKTSRDAYSKSTNRYDDVLTKKKLWSKLYIKLIWGGVDYADLADELFDIVPEDFKGKLLDVPVGTAVFTASKYSALGDADITCLDYSEAMLSQAEEKFKDRELKNILCVQGDVGNMPFPDENFDVVISMNGFHAFPDKKKAFSEVNRVLKKGGVLSACQYVRGESRMTDLFVKMVLARRGLFAPPFHTLNELEAILKDSYSSVEMHNKKGTAYYKCIK